MANKIECHLSDIAHYQIEPVSYDFIFAVSSFEHLDSEDTFDIVVEKFCKGLRLEESMALSLVLT